MSLFLIGIASAQTFVAVMAFVILLQFSSNFAQGPFQGYVPDLVGGEAGRGGQRAGRDHVDPRERGRDRHRVDRPGDAGTS